MSVQSTLSVTRLVFPIRYNSEGKSALGHCLYRLCWSSRRRNGLKGVRVRSMAVLFGMQPYQGSTFRNVVIVSLYCVGSVLGRLVGKLESTPTPRPTTFVPFTSLHQLLTSANVSCVYITSLDHTNPHNSQHATPVNGAPARLLPHMEGVHAPLHLLRPPPNTPAAATLRKLLLHCAAMQKEERRETNRYAN